ncbi:MAG TPA: hypothetical protein PK087_01295 [Bacilli bacterium]|nr:MAG: hypothetical protein BWY97_00375 [Tenericutes bacterium ADurb.BinA124]HOH17936.1 hypothetical protein [Bacilli bacterium]
MVKKGFKKVFFAIMTIAMVLFVSLSLTYSWFIKTNETTYIIQAGEFEASMAVAFSGNVISTGSPYYDTNKKVIIIDAGDASSTNHIENLSVSLTITPEVTARFRIKIQDEWQLKRTYYAFSDNPIIEAISHENEAIFPGNTDYPFTIANLSNYIFDSESGYLYYNLLLEKGETLELEFITSGKARPVFANSAFYEECYVYLDFIVDIVQANRFSEVWGISPDYFE